MFSPAARAKHDAWLAQFRKYSVEPEGLADAQKQYIAIAKSVGWDGHIEEEEEDDVDLEHLDDSDGDSQSANPGEGSKPKGQGMGTKVSMMSADMGERDTK